MTPQEILKFNLDNGSIKAFIEGKPLQVETSQESNRWGERGCMSPDTPPYFCKLRYRPKPEPLEGWVGVYKDDDGRDHIGAAIYDSCDTARRHCSTKRIAHLREVIE